MVAVTVVAAVVVTNFGLFPKFASQLLQNH
jgi:hypothetical protein